MEINSAHEKKNRKILSIITINYNNGSNLLRTLSSLEQFRYNPCVEFIFIDGASTDCSLSIAEKFYLPENLVSEVDAGIYNAMNKGLRMAEGKYVLWLNSGDVLKHNVEASVLSKLRNSKADLISFGLEMCSVGESIPYITWMPKINDLPKHTLPHPTTFFLRNSVLSHAGYDESYRIAGDRDLIVRMFLSNCIIETNDEIIGVFYLGGLSGHKLAIFENLQIDRNLKLIGNIEYLKKIMKYQLNNLFTKLSR